MHNSKELITAKEAAKRLGVHSNTIYRPAREGKYKQETINRRAYLVWENGGLVASDKVTETETNLRLRKIRSQAIPKWLLPDNVEIVAKKYHCFIGGRSLCGRYTQDTDDKVGIDSGEVLEHPRIACKICKNRWTRAITSLYYKG